MSGDRTVFLFIDVDGYCISGVNQSRPVSRDAEGYRPRELGWAYYAEGDHATGSIYFHDADLTPLEFDQSIYYTRGLHGLPVHATAADYTDGAIVAPSTALISVIRALHECVSALGRVVFVHKGGHEGLWAESAVPGAAVIDLGDHGCPRVDAIVKTYPGPKHDCGCHHRGAPSRKKKKSTVHCPQFEIRLMAHWLGEASR